MEASTILRAYCPSCNMLRALWCNRCIVCNRWMGRRLTQKVRVRKKVEAQELRELLVIPARKEVDQRPLPPAPTTAAPGSLKKIEVMEQRWADGYHPHHPLDLVYQESDEPRHSFNGAA